MDRLRQLFPEPLAAAASIKLEEEASSERRRRVYAVFPNPQQANEAYEVGPTAHEGSGAAALHPCCALVRSAAGADGARLSGSPRRGGHPAPPKAATTGGVWDTDCA